MSRLRVSKKHWNLFVSKNFRKKVVSLFSGIKPGVNTLDFAAVSVDFNKEKLEFPEPEMNKLSDTYVLIRKLLFDPEVKINIMQSFKSLLKWKELNLHCLTVLRDYTLGFEVSTGEINYSDIHLNDTVKIYEEIILVLPYIKKVNRRDLFRVPIMKKPVYKSYFTREQMRLIREKTAEQNKTGWTNIEIFEIYNKFHYNFFLSIKQVSGSKELECMPDKSLLDRSPDKSYYLVIGRKRDSGTPVRAIINPADINQNV